MKLLKEEIKKFLDDYKASVEFISGGSDEAIEMIVNANILPKAAIAKKALPNCNVCFLDGAAMKSAMETYLGILHGIAPASIGGKLPADNFYYAK